MNARERAGAILDRWNLDVFTIGRTGITSQEIIDTLERAFQATIEDCAKIADIIAEHRNSDPAEEHTARTIAEQIRALK